MCKVFLGRDSNFCHLSGRRWSTWLAFAAELIKLYFKKDFKQFTIESFYLPGVERTYTSFSNLSQDIAISRIYTGFQFRNDVVQAEKMGRELVRYVFKNNLRVLR